MYAIQLKTGKFLSGSNTTSDECPDWYYLFEGGVPLIFDCRADFEYWIECGENDARAYNAYDVKILKGAKIVEVEVVLK